MYASTICTYTYTALQDVSIFFLSKLDMYVCQIIQIFDYPVPTNPVNWSSTVDQNKVVQDLLIANHFFICK